MEEVEILIRGEAGVPEDFINRRGTGGGNKRGTLRFNSRTRLLKEP